jgi:hypothetical protein
MCGRGGRKMETRRSRKRNNVMQVVNSCVLLGTYVYTGWSLALVNHDFRTFKARGSGTGRFLTAGTDMEPC